MEVNEKHQLTTESMPPPKFMPGSYELIGHIALPLVGHGLQNENVIISVKIFILCFLKIKAFNYSKHFSCLSYGGRSFQSMSKQQ